MTARSPSGRCSSPNDRSTVASTPGLAEQRGHASRVDQHVGVTLVVAAPRTVVVRDERGDLADEHIRCGHRVPRDDGPVVADPPVVRRVVPDSPPTPGRTGRSRATRPDAALVRARRARGRSHRRSGGSSARDPRRRSRRLREPRRRATPHAGPLRQPARPCARGRASQVMHRLRSHGDRRRPDVVSAIRSRTPPPRPGRRGHAPARGARGCPARRRRRGSRSRGDGRARDRVGNTSLPARADTISDDGTRPRSRRCGWSRCDPYRAEFGAERWTTR